MHHKIAQLMLNPGRTSPTVSDIFVAQPDAYKEELAGKLFILIEVKGKKIDGLKVINFLIDNIAHNYYQNEKIALREKITTLKVEHIFEIALTRTNKHLAEFLENEKINIKPEAINITVGVLHDNLLHFANNGSNRLFLLYKNKSEARTRNTKEKSPNSYKCVDIAQKADDRERRGQKNKLFTNVLSGEIPPKGHFFITNEALPEYITSKQMIDIITALPPASAVEQIKHTVTQINSYVPFLGIIIKSSASETDIGETRTAPQNTEDDSISSLNKTEENTENLLTPSGLINPIKWLKLPIRSKQTSQAAPARANLSLKEKIFMKKKRSGWFGQAQKAGKTFARFLVLALLLLSRLPARSKSLYTRLPETKSRIKHGILGGARYLAGMKKKSKVLLAVAVVFLGLFIFNLSVIKIKNEEAEKAQQYKQLTEKIEKKQNNIEANLLYNNEEAAQELFREIEELMAELPRQTQEQKDRYNNFKEKFEKQLAEVRHETEPGQTKVLADFKNISQKAEPRNLALARSSNSIYASDARDNSIYILDLESKKTTTATDLDSAGPNLRYPAVNDNGLIYYLNGGSVLSFDPANRQLAETGATIQGEATNYASADTYGSRYYLLNTQQSEIYRFSPTANGLGPPQPWLRQDIDLKNAVDMSIDGHIYALKSNGKVIKLLRGTPRDFDLEKVDPPLTAPNKLHVSLEGEFLYILEGANKRLLVFDKSGEFVIQYKFEQYDKLLDFTIDASENKLYLLADKKIIRAKLQHLEPEE